MQTRASLTIALTVLIGLLSGSVSAVAGQAGSGIERLAGSWSLEQAGVSGPPFRHHYRFDIRGKDVLAFQVADEDSLGSNRIKGDEVLVYRFQLTGRRVNGEYLVARNIRMALRGIVDEAFNQIEFEVSQKLDGGSVNVLPPYTFRRLSR